MGVNEAKGHKKLTKLMITNTWDLLETIDRFANFAHIIRIITINKSQWLNHENIFKQVTLKKNIINIKLTNKPTTILRTRRIVVGLTTRLKVS